MNCKEQDMKLRDLS